MKRYLVLFASVLMQLCLGGIYAWSAFAPALCKNYQWSASQTALVFGVGIGCFTLFTIPAGRLMARVGPKPIAAAGSVLFGGGYLFASFSSGQFYQVLTGIGLIAGAGIGLCYVCPLASCVAWFPKRKGTITGLAVAGFGAGAIFLSHVVEAMLLRGYDVMHLFRLIGISCGLTILACSAVLCLPARSCASPGLAPGSASRPELGAVLRQAHFWLLVLGMFAGTFGGLLVIGNLKPIGLANGFSSAQAAAAVGVFAVGNTLGRVLWGMIYDRAGRVAIPASLVLLAAGSALLGFAADPLTFFSAVLLTGFAFGGCFVLYASDLVSVHGSASLGQIYPLIFQAYGLSGIIGPAVGGWAFDRFSSFLPGVLAAVAILLAGALATWRLGCQRQDRQCSKWALPLES